ncbi:unnamed protein product, partial [Amoebophrya sp. A25]
APGENGQSVKEIIRVAKRSGVQSLLFDYVDDIRAVLPPPLCFSKEATDLDLDRQVYLFTVLGCKVHHKKGKLIPASTAFPWLGFEADTINMKMRIEERRRTEYIKDITSFLDELNENNFS